MPPPFEEKEKCFATLSNTAITCTELFETKLPFPQGEGYRFASCLGINTKVQNVKPPPSQTFCILCQLSGQGKLASFLRVYGPVIM